MQKGGEVSACEGPLEGSCGGLVVLLEAQQPIFEAGQGGEVVGCEDLALDDGECAAGAHRKEVRNGLTDCVEAA